MKQQYQNLGELLKNEPDVYDYFTSLPVYTRSMIARRSENVHTYEELQHYAENLLRRD